jgi:hypothetical protein
MAGDFCVHSSCGLSNGHVDQGLSTSFVCDPIGLGEL